MAQSRTERIGTIFSRITSLLKGGEIQQDNLPLWYAIYKAFPPKDEPTFNRRPSQKEIPNIFYKEDEIRAKFQKGIEHLSAINLTSTKPSQSQLFLNMYNAFLKRGVDQEEAYKQALVTYKSLFNIKKRGNINASAQSSSEHDSEHTETINPETCKDCP